MGKEVLERYFCIQASCEVVFCKCVQLLFSKWSYLHVWGIQRYKISVQYSAPIWAEVVGKVFVHFAQHVKAEEDLSNPHITNLYALQLFNNTNIVPNFLGKIARWYLNEVSY